MAQGKVATLYVLLTSYLLNVIQSLNICRKMTFRSNNNQIQMLRRVSIG